MRVKGWMFVVAILMQATFVGAVLYVAWHFISKYW